MRSIEGNQVAQVMFADIVGYSQQSTSQQARLIADLTQIVNQSPSYRDAHQRQEVLSLPTGDGMALVFFGNVSAAANVACDVARALRSNANLPLRIGLHSGLIQSQTDINGQSNVVGEGINTAQRVMDVGDSGHILCSESYADLLKQFDEWKGNLVPLGDAVVKHGQIVSIFSLVGPNFGKGTRPARLKTADPVQKGSLEPKKVCLLYKRNCEPDETLLHALEDGLKQIGHDVFVDRHLQIGVEWAAAIESRIRQSDAVIALISSQSATSEMLEYEIEVAFSQRQQSGSPKILPVRIQSEDPLEGQIGALVNPLNYSIWRSPTDNDSLVNELAAALSARDSHPGDEVHLEPTGGAVPVDSPFYIPRDSDKEFLTALEENESILLVKGPRQMGKTSLIARGVQQARESNWRIANLDFQKLSSAQLANDNAFYRLVAATIARQLGYKYNFAEEWLEEFGANMNLDFFMRALLEDSEVPLVWFMDEADRLFGLDFASDFFGLVRSWHNSRAMDPSGPWARFTIVIGYATEAHLFIQDLNQSPFNVGRQIQLQPFTYAQFAELNRRHRSPVADDSLTELYNLVGGQPFLSRRAFEVLTRGTLNMRQLLDSADRDEGAFGDHLKRILMSVSTMPAVVEALRSSIDNPSMKDTDGFYRLLAAGVVQLTAEKKVVFKNDLYRRYLSAHL